MLTTIFIVLVVTFLAMQISGFSTTIYLHRTMAHKGLKLHPAVAFYMRAQLWMFTGIVTREWVAVHRKHHHFADEEGDPHSPYLKGLWNVLLWNAYYYARETKNPEVVEHYTRDIPATRADFMLDRGWLGLLLGVGLFMALFSQIVGGWAGLAVGFGTFILQGAAYIMMNAVINGACHAIGYKNFNNTATNLRWVAWFSNGEGLHNNHHQYPSATKFSMKKWEFDPAWPVIRTLMALRLARPVTATPQEAQPA